MSRCLISFGANLGVPAVTIGQAVQSIREMLGERLMSLDVSRPVRTPAVGGPTGQPPFVNAVAALQVVDCSAWDVWHIVREVEHKLGRVRQERWEARRIDVDVLLFDDQRIWTPQFKLPHPRMVMRRFILEPATDVAADWIEPVSGWTIGKLAAALTEAPASLLLLSSDMARDQALADRAAAVAQCEIVPNAPWVSGNQSMHAALPMPQPLGRWLRLASADLIKAETSDAGLIHSTSAPWPLARLTCVLAPPSLVTDAAWEDIHRPLARWMGLCSTSHAVMDQTRPLWLLPGPRYLLSTDDLVWAQHEIVAAMDAMDCPVEPMRT